jgi:hypothetical protein
MSNFGAAGMNRQIAVIAGKTGPVARTNWELSGLGQNFDVVAQDNSPEAPARAMPRDL